ncbi:hypothetical protein DTO021D3_5144 [Paecilomyces variotii]|nr:hypothetical protein DTO032I3_5463 [Paecilomyces variotii]KAJ9278012.1 hypothetical protein DTO021D3_5144 [Paecilomyces variotii]KAJ9341829.1 hypothetical protein DTO027B6_5611 [Paecilomyces variotii]KAJ9389399.1 hypothetical protein DTO032I4_2424 [Paecilomyces variotii]
MPARRKEQKPKALSSVPSQYNFRSRARYSKPSTQKDALKGKTKVSIRKPDVYNTRTTTTDMQALPRLESPLISKEEILENFTDSLNDTRTAIRRDLELSLVQKEEEALDLLMKKYSSTQQYLARSSRGEKTLAKSRPSGRSPELVMPSSANLQNLRDEPETDQRQLDGLWKEWGKTQQKIVSLGVEVLGPARFNILEDQLRGSFKKKINSAKASRQESEGDKEDLQRAFREDVEKIKDLSKKAIAKSKAKAKAWRVEKRKYWGVMKDLAQKLVAHS